VRELILTCRQCCSCTYMRTRRPPLCLARRSQEGLLAEMRGALHVAFSSMISRHGTPDFLSQQWESEQLDSCGSRRRLVMQGACRIGCDASAACRWSRKVIDRLRPQHQARIRHSAHLLSISAHFRAQVSDLQPFSVLLFTHQVGDLRRQLFNGANGEHVYGSCPPPTALTVRAYFLA